MPEIFITFGAAKILTVKPWAGIPQGRWSRRVQTPLYKELKRDVNGRDKHSAKIAAQKLSFARLAVDWEAVGKIDATARDEIIYITESAPFELWRPLIYVIPRPPVESRLQSVHPSKRAGLGAEFIIADLQRSEFDLIEL